MKIKVLCEGATNFESTAMLLTSNHHIGKDQLSLFDSLTKQLSSKFDDLQFHSPLRQSNVYHFLTFWKAIILFQVIDSQERGSSFQVCYGLTMYPTRFFLFSVATLGQMNTSNQVYSCSMYNALKHLIFVSLNIEQQDLHITIYLSKNS